MRHHHSPGIRGQLMWFLCCICLFLLALVWFLSTQLLEQMCIRDSNMTVEQNVLCGLKAEKDKATRKARCAEMLQAMRLESLAKRYPAQLSGGQQQRTALALSLIHI